MCQFVLCAIRGYEPVGRITTGSRRTYWLTMISLTVRAVSGTPPPEVGWAALDCGAGCAGRVGGIGSDRGTDH